ncbi:MAG: PAS domain-containing protein [Betaproteobacteria bacterium]|nr:PAS domain-containing protein [Betaproteobacteria bacterium]
MAKRREREGGKETQVYLPTLPAHALDRPPEGVGEDVWIDVIRKMDEVYSDLLQYEVALEEKNAKLEETQKFIFSVLTSMSDVLVVCDRHGVIQEVNQALADLVGKDEAELRGTPLIDLFADDASRAQAQRFLKDLHSERIHDCELHFRCRYAPEMPVAVNCTPRLSPVGKFVGMVMTGRPVGDLRRAYEQLRQAHEELKVAQQQLIHSEKMASLGRLVAGVAHELNNPISFVLGNVYALQRYGQRMQEYLAALHAGKPAQEIEALRKSLRIDRLMEDMKPLIDGTIEGAERTRDIVAGLKRFSAADRGDEENFNLAEVLERSVHWVVKASGSKIKVVLAVPQDIPVSGSSGQMQQVLVNLVQNAIDSTEKQADARLEIGAELRSRSVVLTFHDNGAGFRQEALDKMFDPFFTTKPVGKGTGLGLSISYGIVERHRGQLKASNHPEGGAVLTLTLPLAGAPGGGYEDSTKTS